MRADEIINVERSLLKAPSCRPIDLTPKVQYFLHSQPACSGLPVVWVPWPADRWVDTGRWRWEGGQPAATGVTAVVNVTTTSGSITRPAAPTPVTVAAISTGKPVMPVVPSFTGFSAFGDIAANRCRPAATASLVCRSANRAAGVTQAAQVVQAITVAGPTTRCRWIPAASSSVRPSLVNQCDCTPTPSRRMARRSSSRCMA